MDKISFIIPNEDKFKKEKLTNANEPIVIQGNNEVKKIERKDNNNYIKIAPNVYKFESTNINLTTDIYILYNIACQMKNENKNKALNLFKECRQLINTSTKDEIKYEIFINLALLTTDLNGDSNEIYHYYEEAIKIYSDRSEPYYYWGIYCNKIEVFDKAYDLLKKSLSLSYDEVKLKYPKTQLSAYGKYLYDELSTTCFWLKKYEEANELLEKIINDPDFSEHKERLETNLEFTKDAMLNM